MTTEFKNLISQYIHGGYLLRQVVAHMPLQHLLARPIAGKWSSLEVVCHISDFEPIFADRMKRVIALENPQLLGADENLFLKSLSYHQRNLGEELALIDLVRSQMARILTGLPDSAWVRVGIHSEKGPVSLRNLLEKAIGHVDHHLPFIEQKKKNLASN